MPVDIMIVGAQKSGTTSLLAYLGDHPSIEPQPQREMTWFTEPEQQPFPEQFYFGSAAPGGLRLGKLAGLMYQPDAVARLATHNANVAVLAILRNPVERAYSSFWHMRGRGHEQTFSHFEQAMREAIERAANGVGSQTSYLEWSSYEPPIRRLQSRFGDALSVLIFEEFVADPVSVTLPLLERWGLDIGALSPDAPRENPSGGMRSHVAARLTRARASRLAKRMIPPKARLALRRQYVSANLTASRPPPIDRATERALRDLFREPNRRLEDLLGRSIDVWAEPLHDQPSRSAVSQPDVEGY